MDCESEIVNTFVNTFVTDVPNYCLSATMTISISILMMEVVRCAPLCSLLTFTLLPEKPILCSNISVRSFIAAIVGNLEAVIGERSPVPGKNKQTNRRQWLTEERGQRRTLIRNSSITLEMVRKRTCSRCDRASRKSTVPSVEKNVSTEQGDAHGRGVHWGSISNFREVCSNHHDWTSLLEGKRGGAENNLWEE